jgi:hypothetical protein
MAETAKHFLLDCRGHLGAMAELRRNLGRRAREWKYLMGDEKGMKEVAKFAEKTGRFKAEEGEQEAFLSWIMHELVRGSIDHKCFTILRYLV